MNKLIIIGAGGHGRVVADCAELNGYREIEFLDDCYPERTTTGKWQVIGKVSDWQKYLNNTDFIVAFGNNVLRSKTISLLQKNDINLISLIHPKAVLSTDIILGQSCVVLANAVINIGSTVNDGCIINTSATVDHDCHLAKCVHISPGANIAGGVKVGAFSWIGIGSAVIEYISLGINTKTGAGAVITAPTDENALYVGIPAKKIKSLESVSN